MNATTEFIRAMGGKAANPLAPRPPAPGVPPGGSPADSAKPRKKRPYTGYVASLKNGAAVPWRRSVERDLMHLLEADPQVRSYSRRPERIVVRVGEEVREHVVGFRVVTARGTVMLDILPPGRSDPEAVHEAAAEHYARQRRAYATISEAEIRLEPRLSQAAALLTYRQVEPPPAFLLAAAEAVARGARTVGDIERALTEWQPVRAYVCAAALRGHLRLDLSNPVSETTAVRP